jgi:hypothetical protein
MELTTTPRRLDGVVACRKLHRKGVQDQGDKEMERFCGLRFRR